MNQNLQKLIDIAEEGGAITPKQREIILKKAQELGEDLDEVEMVLESIQSKQVAKEPMKREGRRKCPNCGATINGTTLVCPECGYVLQQESKASIEARASIDKLQEKLTEAANSTSTLSSFLTNADETKQAQIINTFSMPATKEGLTYFLEFAYSNYSATEANDNTLRQAWYSKTIQAYNSLTRLCGTDPEIKALLEKYSSLISKEKKKNLRLILYFAAAVLGIAFIAFMGTRSDNSASKEVGECLRNNDFAGARAAAHKSTGEIRLLDEISVQEVSFLIEEHKYGQARIVASGIEDQEKKEAVLTSIQNAEKQSLGNN